VIEIWLVIAFCGMFTWIFLLPLWALEPYDMVEVWQRIAVLFSCTLFWPVTLAVFILWGIISGIQMFRDTLRG